MEKSFQLGDIIHITDYGNYEKIDNKIGIYEIIHIVEGLIVLYKVRDQEDVKWFFNTQFKYATPEEIKLYKVKNLFTKKEKI
jgi:hypothetical protein